MRRKRQMAREKEGQKARYLKKKQVKQDRRTKDWKKRKERKMERKKRGKKRREERYSEKEIELIQENLALTWKKSNSLFVHSPTPRMCTVNVSCTEKWMKFIKLLCF